MISATYAWTKGNAGIRLICKGFQNIIAMPTYVKLTPKFVYKRLQALANELHSIFEAICLQFQILSHGCLTFKIHPRTCG